MDLIKINHSVSVVVVVKNMDDIHIKDYPK